MKCRPMRIGVVGYGVTQGFRSKGHDVYVNDIRQFKSEKIYDKKFLMDGCDLIFICVPTPSKPDGNLDLTYIEQAIEDLHSYRRCDSNNPIIVIKSTVIPGTTLSLASKYPKLKFAFNPEFLRMKHALHDFLYPDRNVIGACSIEIAKKVSKAYEDWKCRMIITDLNTAETIKLVANCFLTLKVAYACETNNICNVLGLDAKEIMDAVCIDNRIGTDHLDPSKGPIPRNSPCLPKDTSGMIRFLESKGYDSKLLRAAYAAGIEKGVCSGK